MSTYTKTRTLVKQNKILVVFAVIAVLASLVYFFRKKIFTNWGAAGNSNNTPIKIGGSTNPSEIAMLKKGSKGPQVKELQRLINNKQRAAMPSKDGELVLLYGAMEGALLVEDGIFGNKTETALYKWTKLNSITLAQAREILG